MGSHPSVTIHAALIDGSVGRAAEVYSSVESGQPGLRVSDVPERQSDETARRLIDALLASGLPVPAADATIEVSPGPLRGVHPELDLPMALAVLAACGHLTPATVAGVGAVGELRTNGSVERTFPLGPALDAIAAPVVVVPAGHLALGSRPGTEIVRVASLRQAVETLCERAHTLVTRATPAALEEAPSVTTDVPDYVDTLVLPNSTGAATADEPRGPLRRAGRILPNIGLRRPGG